MRRRKGKRKKIEKTPVSETMRRRKSKRKKIEKTPVSETIYLN